MEASILTPPPPNHSALGADNTKIGIVTAAEIQCSLSNFTRRNLFKVMVALEGTCELHYATRSYLVNRPR